MTTTLPFITFPRHPFLSPSLLLSEPFSVFYLITQLCTTSHSTPLKRSSRRTECRWLSTPLVDEGWSLEEGDGSGLVQGHGAGKRSKEGLAGCAEFAGFPCGFSADSTRLNLCTWEGQIMASSIKCTSLKKLVQGLLARRFLLRMFMLISAMATLPFLFVSELNLVEFLAVSSGDCAAHQLVTSGNYLKPFTFLESRHSSSACHADNNFTYAVFRALMDVNLIPSNAKALCVGERSGAAVRALRKLGFPHPISANRGPLSVLQRKDFFEELPFEDGSFDFIFSRGLNKASAPALHVLEMERVLKPSGTGAVMEPVATANPSSMIKAATPVSSFLKCSDIVYVGMIDGFALAVFKKRTDDLSSIEQLHLPKGCLSVTNNRPFTWFLEPLMEKVHVEDRKNVAYLSERMNISNRRQLMYVDVGAGRYKDSSIASWFLPFYPKQSLPLQIYALDHDSSTLSSFAQRHDITFVYYPDLGESRPVADFDPLDDSGALPFDDGDESDMFDFLGWFKDAVEEEDFVVLKMSVGGVGLRDLLELVESGAICLVDELFLHCPDTMGGGDATTGTCLQLFKTLRRMGIYVHQW